MKIIQIGSFPLDVFCIEGGIEASVYGLAIEQAKSNQIFVIDFPRKNIEKDYIEEINGIKVFRFSSKGGNNYTALFRIKTIINIIRELNPDICHIHSTSLFSFFTYLFLRFFHIPAVVTVHGLAHIEKRNLWLKNKNLRNLIKYFVQSLTEFFFLSSCSTVIVDTQYVADSIKLYKKQGKILRIPNCIVIPQGVNPVFFETENIPIQHKLLSVGAIGKRKGHLYLIEVIEKVSAEFPDCSLAIVGTMSEKIYFQLMQKRIKDKGLENQIQIIPNANFEQVLEFYKGASIFVLHSEEESQGIVFCEAMAAGKPIVATNVGGIPWVIGNNVNGLLSGFGDIETFTFNVIRLMKEDELRKKMSETNRNESHKYNWIYIAHEIMVLYKSVI